MQPEQAELDAVLRKPENAEVLERSVFLNTLLLRKGISWTRILADLEKTMPHNVRIIQIHPSVDAEGPGDARHAGGVGIAGADDRTADRSWGNRRCFGCANPDASSRRRRPSRCSATG